MASTTVDAMVAAKAVTMYVTVKRVREFRIRLWIAVRLMHVAAWVAGFGNVEVKNG